MDLYGFEVKVLFLVNKKDIVAYAWHYDKDKALNHLRKIIEFHNLTGRIERSRELERWLIKNIQKTVEDGMEFQLPNEDYRNRAMYENIIKIPRGKTRTYSEIARISEVRYTEMLTTLLRNPFQILIPCHRLLTNKGTLMGFYPLGIQVKRKLLEIEGIRITK